MRIRTRTVVLLLGVLAAGGAGPASAGWWDDLDKGRSVSLPDVIAQPSRYKDQILSFFCIYHGRDQVFAPLAAPFHPQRHENFAVWPDGAPLWEKKAFGRDYPFLYISRAHPQHADLLGLEEFSRIEVTGRVRGMIRARPCIEVRSFRRTGQRLGLEVVRSVMVGDRYSEFGDLDLAYENYRRALQPDLPSTYDLLISKRLAETLRRLGREDEARQIEGSRILGGSGPPEPEPAPPGGRLGDPLPGMPGGNGAPSSAPGTAPAPLTEDLPGQPYVPSPITRDSPGTPVGPAPAPPAPLATDLPGQPVGPPVVPPDEEETPPVPPPPPAVPPGAPPRRSPRLTGVK